MKGSSAGRKSSGLSWRFDCATRLSASFRKAVLVLPRFVPLCFVISLCGCEERELLRDLNQARSIEALSVLAKSGIHAKRESVSQGRNGAYRIVVPADEFGRAVDIASASALAEDDGAALESLAAGSGFIPPTAEEASFRVRFREALELERVVRAIPGVVRARALVRLTKPVEGARESGPTRTVHLVVSFDSAAVARDELDRQIATVVPQAGDAKLIVSLLPMADAADGTALSAPATVRLGFPFSFDVLASQTKRVQAQLYALIGGAIVSALMVGLSFGFHLARRRRRTRSGDSKATDRSRATGSFELPEGSRRAGGEPVAGNES